jgi:hypothetical protein
MKKFRLSEKTYCLVERIQRRLGTASNAPKQKTTGLILGNTLRWRTHLLLVIMITIRL